MKKLLIALLFASLPASAAYFDYPYYSDAEIEDDVQLIAMAHLAYQAYGEKQTLRNIRLVCKGVDKKYKITARPTERMKYLRSKADVFCSKY